MRAAAREGRDLSDKKNPGWFVGGYLDDSISDSQVAEVKLALAELGGEIDSASFIDWLRHELANYRNLKEINDSLQRVSKDQDSVSRLDASIGALLRELEDMPPTVAGRLDAALLQQGHDMSEVARQSLTRGIAGKLTELRFALMLVESELRHTPKPGKGRKVSALRNLFLDKVRDELLAVGFQKSKASVAAAEILTACGVEAPQDGRSRPEKRRGNN
jgi:hypothetical protein